MLGEVGYMAFPKISYQLSYRPGKGLMRASKYDDSYLEEFLELSDPLGLVEKLYESGTWYELFWVKMRSIYAHIR